MLNQIIARLKQTGEWQDFIKVFTNMQNELIDELRSGNVTLEKLNYINGQLDMLERCLVLDKYKFKGGE